MKKIIILLLIISPLFSLGCSCVGESSVKEEFDRYDVVFEGKVLSSKLFVVNDSNLPRGLMLKKMKYTLLITQQFKGLTKFDTLDLITGIGGGDCGFRFKPDSLYIVYAKYSSKFFGSGKIVNEFLTTNKCSRTGLSKLNEINAIEKMVKSDHIGISNCLFLDINPCIKRIPKVITTNPFGDGSSDEYSIYLEYAVDSLKVNLYDTSGKEIFSVEMKKVESGYVFLNESLLSYKNSYKVETTVFLIIQYYSDGLWRSKHGAIYLSWINREIKE